jgi:hypothetical protein
MSRPIRIEDKDSVLQDLALLSLLCRRPSGPDSVATHLDTTVETVSAQCDRLVGMGLLEVRDAGYTATRDVQRLLAPAGHAPVHVARRRTLIWVALAATVPGFMFAAASRPHAAALPRTVPRVAVPPRAEQEARAARDSGPTFCLVASRDEAASQAQEWFDAGNVRGESEVLDAGESALAAWAVLANTNAPALVIVASVEQEVHVRDVVASANMIRESSHRPTISIVDLRPPSAG